MRAVGIDGAILERRRKMLYKRHLELLFLFFTAMCTGILILPCLRPDVWREYVVKAVKPENDSEKYHHQHDEHSLCRQLQATELPRFIEIERGTLLYSAWLDDREVHSYIQILLLTSRRKNPPPIFCRFQNGSLSNISTRAVSPYHEINKRYSKKRYGLFVVSCGLPKNLVSEPCFVEISIELASEQPLRSAVLPLGNVKRQGSVAANRSEYGICVPPLHGNILVGPLIEFFKLSQVLGASYFIFYDFETPENVSKVLNYYTEKGVAQVLSWKLPSYIGDDDVHYYGQIFAMQDCLFRTMNQLKFVAFNDLDEFIVPLHYEKMTDLLHKIHGEKHCGHCFKSARFQFSLEGKVQLNSWSVTQTVLNRSRNADETHVKCVVDPQRVFEHGVRLIMQPLASKYTVDNVEWNVARVFHYQECKGSCNTDLEFDNTMQRYGERLRQRISFNQ